MWSSLKQHVDWLCAAALEHPKPRCSSGIDPLLRECIRGRRVCEDALAYLSFCVPTHFIDYDDGPGLFSAQEIDFVTGDYFAEVCAQGFVGIAHLESGEETFLLNLEKGTVHLFAFDTLSGDHLFERGQKNTPITEANIIRLSERSWVNVVDFLVAFREYVEAVFVEVLWDVVLGGLGENEGTVADSVYIESLRSVLATPIDARTIRDDQGMSLLDVARERGRKATIPILKAYWANPDDFRTPIAAS